MNLKTTEPSLGKCGTSAKMRSWLTEGDAKGKIKRHGERVSRMSRYGSNMPDAQGSMGAISCSLLLKTLLFGLPPLVTGERSKAGAFAKRGTESMMPSGFRESVTEVAGSLFFK